MNLKKFILCFSFTYLIFANSLPVYSQDKTRTKTIYEDDIHYDSTNIAEPNSFEDTHTTNELEKGLFENDNSPDTIWEQYNNKFLFDVENADNQHKQKAQEIVDDDIEYKLHIKLDYLNLKQCLETALENNFNIKISSNIKTAGKWEYRNSLAKFIPDFFYEYQIRHVEGEYLVGNVLLDYISENPVQSTFNFGWYNVNFAERFFEARAAKEKYRAANFDYEYTKDEILRDAAVEYYNLLEKKLNIEVLRINLKEREQQLTITQGRYDLGVGTKFDILRAEAQVAQAKQEYIAAYNSLRLNQAMLANIMGIDVLEPVYPFEMTANTISTVEKDLNIEDLYKFALNARDDVKSLEREIKSLKEQKKVIFMQYAPVITAEFSHQNVGVIGEHLRSNDTLALIGQVYLGKNLGIGTYTQLKKLDAQIQEQTNRLTNLKRNIKESILNDYYDSLTSKEKIKASKKEVKAGDEGLKNALVRWDIGENTFLDVLQAQTTKTTARQELISSIIDYNKSQVKLLFNAGIISINSILRNYPLFEKDNPHNQ